MYIYIYVNSLLFFLKMFSIMAYHKILNIVLCAIYNRIKPYLKVEKE